MSALLLAAAAAGFAPPSFSVDDMRELQQNYPPAALHSRLSAGVLIDAQVNPKGRVKNCKALTAVGDRQLAASICGIVEGMRIEPATVQGRSSFGVIRQFVRFTIPGTETGDAIAALRETSDIEVQVNMLPAGQSSLRVNANVLVGANGKPQACNAGDAPAGYGDVACRQVSGITFGTLNDDDGKPVQYVRTVIVDFVTQPAAG